MSFIIWIVLEARYNPPKGFCILPKSDVNPCVGIISPVREIPALACIKPLKEASPVNSGESFVDFNDSNKLAEVSNLSKRTASDDEFNIFKLLYISLMDASMI